MPLSDTFKNIINDYKKDSFLNKIDFSTLLTCSEVTTLMHYFEMAIFPKLNHKMSLEEVLNTLLGLLRVSLNKVLEIMQVEGVISKFFSKITNIRSMVDEDISAFFKNDPACFSKEEVVLSYPGFKAIMFYRIAHEFYSLSVPLLPRMISEIIHSQTGIDINPGSTIGRRFFIDHGTGVVIGETCIIGNGVSIYQGVTLGALSTRGGQKLKGKKRHPTIEDDVIIYSGATVLGGETIIGKGSIIGGNAFISSSVPPNSKIFN